MSMGRRGPAVCPLQQGTRGGHAVAGLGALPTLPLHLGNYSQSGLWPAPALHPPKGSHWLGSRNKLGWHHRQGFLGAAVPCRGRTGHGGWEGGRQTASPPGPGCLAERLLRMPLGLRLPPPRGPGGRGGFGNAGASAPGFPFSATKGAPRVGAGQQASKPLETFSTVRTATTTKAHGVATKTRGKQANRWQVEVQDAAHPGSR